ncbi:MAG: C39 family peptidase [Anaerolinea sp.]|nr:C39 family peptidase [Anaerolinea sp.]
MPPILLPVTHLRQSSEATCLAVCARMVLAYAGDLRSEQELVSLLGIDPSYGAPASRILRLERLGYRVVYDSVSLSLLRSALERNIPPIVLLKTGFLGYWSENVSHACLLTGIAETHVFLHDPWLPSGPVTVTRTEFIAAWTEMDYLAAMITPLR